MKYLNNSFAWVLIASLLLVSVNGCMQSADVGDEEMVIESYTGVLSELPNATKQLFDATHSFEAETGNVIYVRSLIYDLYDNMYEDALVRISGVPRDVEGRKTLTVDKVEVLEENISEDEVKFEQYVNQELGLSLEIPVLTDVDSTKEKVEISGIPGAMTIEKIEIGDSSSIEDELSEAKTIKVGVDAVEGYVVNTEFPDEEFRYYVKRNNENFYLITYAVNNEGESDRNLAEEITNSLRFIPFSDTEEPTEDENTEEPVEEDEPNIEPVENDDVEEVDSQPVSDAVLENYRSLESRPLGFSAYYPKNWYYAQVERGYAFAEDPVEDENWLAYLKVGDHNDVELSEDWIALTKNIDDHSFTIYGPADKRTQLETVLRTLDTLE